MCVAAPHGLHLQLEAASVVTIVEERVQIPTPDGTADALLYRQEQERRPGVLFLTDIGGIRSAQQDMARRIAGEGYTVLVPNLFYRIAQPPVMPQPVKWADPQTGARIRELAASVPPDAAERDAKAYVDFLGTLPSVQEAKPITVVGFCYSGAFAMRVAAAVPDPVGTVASFHGGRLYTDEPSSPHFLLPRIKARLYFGHADGDRSMPKEAIDKFDAALAAWGGNYESEIYQGAGHGWTVPDNPSYNQHQAERAYSKLRDLLSANDKLAFRAHPQT